MLTTLDYDDERDTGRGIYFSFISIFFLQLLICIFEMWEVIFLRKVEGCNYLASFNQ